MAGALCLTATTATASAAASTTHAKQRAARSHGHVSHTASAARAPRAGRRRGTRHAHAHAARVAIGSRRLNVAAGGRVRVSGHVRLSAPGRRPHAALQVRRGHRWVTLTRRRTSPTGRYVLRARLASAMSAPARVRIGTGLTRRLGHLNVYRFAQASWYGPGLYGQPLACGGTLGAGELGVANKTLPCGTRLTIRHGGHMVRVRVIDRGPYVAGREFDLTAATAARLGFAGTGAIQVTG